MSITSDYQRESVKFMERDFTECFAEKRRYEDAAWDVCKFAFSVSIGVVTLALGAYQFAIEHRTNLIPAALTLLTLGLMIGIFFVLLLARNRVYFVIVTRYINAHRAFYLDAKPLGFDNPTGFFADATQPPYFSWRSTQTWAMQVVAALNATTGATLLFICLIDRNHDLLISALTFGLVFGLQIVSVRQYLMSRESIVGANGVAFGAPKAP